MPFEKVDDAIDEVILRAGVERPDVIVEVAEPLTCKTPAMVVEPVFPMENKVVVAKLLVVDEILKSESAFEVEAANRERRP